MLANCCVIKEPKICKKKVFKYSNLCLNHYKLKYHKYILIIQKYYKGYRCRKYIKGFKKYLPRELQIKIIDIINKDYYYYLYAKKLNTIIYKYVYPIHNYYYIHNNTIHINTFIKAYDLYNKYFGILGINYLKHFLFLGYHLHRYIEEYVNSNFIDSIQLLYKYPILSKIDQKSINNENLNKLKNTIIRFTVLYYRATLKK